MGDLILLITDAAFVNNLVVDHLIGVQACAAFSRRLAAAWNIAISVLVVVLISAPINYLSYRMVVIPFGIDHIAIIIYVMNIFLVAQIYIHLAIKIARIELVRIKAIVALMLLDSVIIGTVLLGMKMTDGLLAFLLYAFGSSIGFGLILFMLTCLRARIRTAYVPAPLRGLPILFVTLAIMSMAFTGLADISA